MAGNCPVSNKFYNVDNFNSFGNITEIEHNLLQFMQTGFWCTGSFAQVSQAMPLGSLRQMNAVACSGNDGLVWQSVMGGWVPVLSGVEYTAPNGSGYTPQTPQVYDNGVLQSSGDYTVDYKRGNIVFNNAPTGPVTASYSLSLANVTLSSIEDWYTELEATAWDRDWETMFPLL